MRYSKNNMRFSLIILISILVICWKVGTDFEAATASAQIDIPSSEAGLEENFAYLAVTQFDRETEMTDSVDVDLSRTEDGYEITAGGQYRLTGELRGTLTIDAAEQNVHLFLDNASIISKLGPALWCQDASKLVITLMPNTENVISDSGSYHTDAEVEACIYSECDLTINGAGALLVNGYYKDAIRSKDIVKILDGDYTIKCKRTGIRGNDGVLISGGNLKISSEKYGIKTTNTGDEGRGDLVICGGELTVIAGRYAFVVTQADLLIYDCIVFDRSIVDTYNVGGRTNIQEGCVQS